MIALAIITISILLICFYVFADNILFTCGEKRRYCDDLEWCLRLSWIPDLMRVFRRLFLLICMFSEREIFSFLFPFHTLFEGVMYLLAIGSYEW